MKINMADVNAAIGLAQIREYPELLKERKRVFNAYSDAFRLVTGPSFRLLWMGKRKALITFMLCVLRTLPKNNATG